MAKDNIPKVYEPQSFEKRWYEFWEKNDLFHAEPEGGKKPFSIVIPPPNVTGQLHMGHALDNTLQDILIRWRRMQGYNTLWMPGCDHAGIATQAKVEAALRAEGTNRYELGREKFTERVWQWKEEYGSRIMYQLRTLGSSCDWARERFTMDEGCSRAVREVFVSLYEKGLIYQGTRITNWCPSCNTALSDIEVEHETEAGHLWHLRYAFEDGEGYVEIATTRPETMFGDTGIAVHPDDARYKDLVGRNVILPIVNRPIPIFADEYVDPAFGTGAVKVTPAHDPNDYAMGQAHGLEQINIFDEHAVVVEGYGAFTGLNRDEARAAVVAWFEEHGLLDRIEDLNHSVMHCYRCDSALEPWLSEQWFVAVDKLKGPATQVVADGRVAFHPDRWKQSYMTWMENLKDWCISRQLWWGHRIPVFYCDACGWEDASLEDVDACPHCGAEVRQDEDVLDTWFSSQLWTFATQGWPDDPSLMQGHHPTKVLVTARDIIALWVARMIMSSLYFTDEIPFEDVFIYATILAKDGSRMSKSKGNGVDPMQLIETYGADAMRFNLLTLVTGTQDVRFDAEKLEDGTFESPRTEAARGFVTKIWNASRFVQMNLEGFTPGAPEIRTSADAWMFSRLAKLVRSVTSGIEEYRFGDVAHDLYEFFWNEFCDWYIELSRVSLKGASDERLAAQRNLVFVLDNALRLLHPAMPFVTEAIWEKMPHAGDAPALIVAQWPEASDFAQWIDEDAERSVSLLCAVVGAVRSTRARYKLSPKADVPVTVKASEQDVRALIAQSELITSLARVTELSISADASRPAESSAVVGGGCEVYCGLSGLIDFDAERARLEKDAAVCAKDVAKFEKKLSNPGFLAKAAPEIIEKDRARLAELKAKAELIEAQIVDLL